MALLLIYSFLAAKYILHRIVRVYNIAADGQLVKVSTALVKADYDGMCISLPSYTYKKCSTDMFLLVPGEFTTGRNYAEDIRIESGGRCFYVPFDDEIEIVSLF